MVKCRYGKYKKVFLAPNYTGVVFDLVAAD